MNLRLNIIFEDDDVIAINKPSGLLSIPGRDGQEVSLKVLLKEKYGNIFTVHRLDHGTSGVILFAKNEESHKHYSQQFEKRETEKIYYGLVLGSMSPIEGSIDAPISEHPVKKGTMVVHRKGKEALTDFRVIEDFKKYSWVKFNIHTGRTHQIRVHAKEKGHPIVCDDIYGDGKPILLSTLKAKFKLSKDVLEERPMLDRLGLHAFSLRLIDKFGKQVHFEAPIPKDLQAVLKQLRKWL